MEGREIEGKNKKEWEREGHSVIGGAIAHAGSQSGQSRGWWMEGEVVHVRAKVDKWEE